MVAADNKFIMSFIKPVLVEYSDSEEESESCRRTEAESNVATRPSPIKAVPPEQLKSKVLTFAKKRKGYLDAKESQTEDSNEMKCKRKALPLPEDILSMFQASKSEGCKDSNLDHAGRTRSFAHVEGDWPSFVFVPVRCKPDLKDLLKNVMEKVKKSFPDFQAISSNQIHITLSRTVCLRHYWIEPIVDHLKESFSSTASFKCHLDLPELYTNDEKTRSFLGLRIILGEEKLQCLVKKIDGVFSEFGLARYYENASFHISIAWHLGDITKLASATFTEDLQHILDSCETTDRILDVDQICLKTGNKTLVLK